MEWQLEEPATESEARQRLVWLVKELDSAVKEQVSVLLRFKVLFPILASSPLLPLTRLI